MTSLFQKWLTIIVHKKLRRYYRLLSIRDSESASGSYSDSEAYKKLGVCRLLVLVIAKNDNPKGPEYIRNYCSVSLCKTSMYTLIHYFNDILPVNFFGW